MKIIKTVALTWIMILVSLFVLGFVYILFSWILYGDVGLYYMVNASTINDTRAQNTLNVLNLVWQWFPIPMVIGLFLWGMVAAQRREPQGYYG